jgi:hypothetical protein
VVDHEWAERLFSTKPSAYTAVVLVAILTSGAYGLRKHGIFACQADSYDTDRYLAYCQADNYGDYDHGAFWFGLEPTAREAATNADILFVGNSRMQFGLSDSHLADWFSSLALRYYLLGFSYNGNYRFEKPLLHKLRPRAKVYIVNIDLFFEQTETPPARAVMHDSSARSRHEEKRQWQPIHKAVCSPLPFVCGREMAFYRSRQTGSWVSSGGAFKGKAVTYDERVNEQVLATYTSTGREFFSDLPVRSNCAILTMVPTVETQIGTAKAIAKALGLSLVAPQLDGLRTFDASHLDRPSAQRWSAAFIEAAGPHIPDCLGVSEGKLARSQSNR